MRARPQIHARPARPAEQDPVFPSPKSGLASLRCWGHFSNRRVRARPPSPTPEGRMSRGGERRQTHKSVRPQFAPLAPPTLWLAHESAPPGSETGPNSTPHQPLVSSAGRIQITGGHRPMGPIEARRGPPTPGHDADPRWHHEGHDPRKWPAQRPKSAEPFPRRSVSQ